MTEANRPKTTRGQKTRQRLLSETRRLLNEADPRSVTLDQIAQAAGIAKSSILWHFGSKEGLFLEAFDAIIADFEKTFDGSVDPELNIVDRLRLFLRGYAQFVEQHGAQISVFFAFLFDHELDPKLRQRAQALYQHSRDLVARHLDPLPEPWRESLAAALVGLVDGVAIQWHVEPERIDPGAIFDVVIAAVALLTSGQSPVPNHLETNPDN